MSLNLFDSELLQKNSTHLKEAGGKSLGFGVSSAQVQMLAWPLILTVSLYKGFDLSKP